MDKITIKINQFVPKYDFKQRTPLLSYFLFLLFSVDSSKQNKLVSNKQYKLNITTQILP